MTVIYNPASALSSTAPVVGSTGTFTGQLIGGGTTTNNNAAAGVIGEYTSSEVLAGSAIPITHITNANITSVSLTAGDWHVWGVIWPVGAGGTTYNNIQGWISNVSATTPTAPNGGAYALLMAPPGDVGLPVGMRRFSLSGTTTIYLSIRSSFAVGTLSAYGGLYARRMR